MPIRRQPLYASMIAALFLLVLLTGVVFGRAVGSVKGSDDVVAMMREGVKTIAPYLVFVFFAAHFVAMFNRSEEHTSELQSLMRTSYAVFCLKKKNKKKIHQTMTFPHNHFIIANLKSST